MSKSTKLTRVVTEEQYPLRTMEFRWENGTAVGMGIADKPAEYTPREWERRVNNAIDDLWERYGSLYADESGNLYGVEEYFDGLTGKMLPLVWAMVFKPEDVN